MDGVLVIGAAGGMGRVLVIGMEPDGMGGALVIGAMFTT